jgi:phosphoglycerate dehydrogenase-like enzyme
MKALYYSGIDESELALLKSLVADDIILEVIPRDEKEKALKRAGEFDIVVGARIGRDFLEKASSLKYMVIPFAGVPPQDLEILPDFPDITLLNSHFNARYVAEHAWALLLASVKRLCATHEKMKRGDWTPRYTHNWGSALSGGNLLLIGFGGIGKELAKIAKAFKLSVKAIKRTPGDAEEINFLGTREDLPELLPEADYIIVSLPGSENAKGFLGKREFELMKEGVHIVNVGRGQVINEDAFYEALKSGKIGGAGIDTWWIYPKDKETREHTYPSKHPIWEFHNVIFSPHRASHVEGREAERIRDIARIINSIASGNPCNVVDRDQGY